MKNGNRHSGYTIVEALIFLAVSSVLLTSALILVGGQQRKTEFDTSVRNFDSKIQSVIGNVTSGYYNNTGQTTCTVSAGVITVNKGGTGIGQNSNCTFIGQWISLNAAKNGVDITSYAGLRRTSFPLREVQSLAEAKATPITDTREEFLFRGGITGSMKIIGTSQAIDTLAITTTFNTYNSGTLASGSSRSEIHAIDTGAGVDDTNPAQGIQICLTDGARVGIIVLNNGSTRVTLGDGACP